MSVVVYIEDQALPVAPSRKLNLSANYLLSDINDIKARKSGATKTLNLPATNETKLIFGFPEDPNAVDAFNNERQLPGRVEVGGTVVIKGNVRLKEAVSDGKGNVAFYAIQIMADNTDWRVAIKNLNIRDLDYSQYDHTYDIVNQKLSETTDGIVGTIEDEFLVYGLINYGKFSGIAEDNEVATRDLKPALNIKRFFVDIFKNQGYKIESDFVDSDLFSRLYLPFTGKTLGNDDEFAFNNQFKATMSGDSFHGTFYNAFPVPSFQIRDLAATDPVDEFFLFGDRVAFDTEVFDNPGAFTPASSVPSIATNLEGYVPITGAAYTSTVNSRQKFKTTLDGKLQLVYTSWFPLLPNNEAIRAVERIRINLSIKLNGNKIASADNTLFMDPIPAPVGTPKIHNFNTTLETNEIDIEIGDVVTVEFEYYISNSQIVEAPSGAFPIVVNNLESSVTIRQESTFENEVFPDLLEDSVVPVNENLPDIKQLDLVQALKHMFNLYFMTDIDERTIYIEPRNEFYSGETIDMRNKIDINEKIRVLPLGDQENKQIRWRYKTDSTDIAIERRETETGDVLAAHLDDVTNLYAKPGIDENNNGIFAPTAMDTEPNQLGFSVSKIPKLWKTFDDDDTIAPKFNTDFEYRILYYAGVVDLQPGETGYNQVRKAGDSSFFSAQQSLRTDYPHMYSINDLVANDNSLYFNTTNRSHGLFEKHYKGTLRTINDGKLIKAKVYLTENEVENLDFRRPWLVRVEGNNVSCILNKIKGYNPESTKSTDVELITNIADVQLSTLVNIDQDDNEGTIKSNLPQQTPLQTIDDDGVITDVWVQTGNSSAELVFTM